MTETLNNGQNESLNTNNIGKIKPLAMTNIKIPKHKDFQRERKRERVRDYEEKEEP